MNTQHLKDRLALLKDVVDDITDALNADDATPDVSHIAQPREATFRFAFSEAVTIAGLRSLLAAISKRYDVEPGYLMVSWQDYEALKINEKSLVIIHLNNDYTGRDARVVVSPDIEVGEVVFGVLYAPAVASVVDAESNASGQTPLTMPS